MQRSGRGVSRARPAHRHRPRDARRAIPDAAVGRWIAPRRRLADGPGERRPLPLKPTGAHRGGPSAAAPGRRTSSMPTTRARIRSPSSTARGKPVVVSRRVAFPLKTGFPSRWKYGRAAHYLAVSRFVAAELTAAGVPADKISVVHDAVKPAQPVRPRSRRKPLVPRADPRPCRPQERRRPGGRGVPGSRPGSDVRVELVGRPARSRCFRLSLGVRRAGLRHPAGDGRRSARRRLRRRGHPRAGASRANRPARGKRRRQRRRGAAPPASGPRPPPALGVRRPRQGARRTSAIL